MEVSHKGVWGASFSGHEHSEDVNSELFVVGGLEEEEFLADAFIFLACVLGKFGRIRECIVGIEDSRGCGVRHDGVVVIVCSNRG